MASKQFPTKRLNDDTIIPMVAYGTGTALFKRGDFDKLDKRTVSFVETALSVGFHHIDGAELYNTEPEIGAAIKASGIPRSELFITTKVIHSIKDIPAGLDRSLEKLGLDYVDLYLIHSPFFTESKEELQDAWRAMEAVQKTGKAKSIGVSNCMRPQLSSILEIATVKPAINQLEYHPYLQREGLVEWSAERGIATAAFGPLAPLRMRADGIEGPLDPVLGELTKKYGVNDAAVLLRWCIQKGVVAVTTAGSKERMDGYLGLLNFELSDEEVRRISEVGATKHFRGNNWMHDYGDSKE